MKLIDLLIDNNIQWPEGAAGDATRYSPAEGILRSLDYCIEECESLAKQLMSTFDEDEALTLAEQTFSTEINEQLAEDIIQYASRLHSRYQQTESGVTALVNALEQIERWDGFPSTNETWEGSGRPVSYSAAFGSNGERDFMRGVAKAALANYHKHKGAL